MSNTPLTPPSAMADLDHHHQHLRLVSSPSPIRTTEYMPAMAQSALPAVLSPTTDKHPKGKRKRTATKDKLILEEAYSINPKPDKQARLEIVNRVSLNEKEVQIWFQNRRQNDRRKSRPLSPQELAALRFSGMHNIASDPITSRSIVVELDPASFPASDPSVISHVPTSPSHMPNSPHHAHPHHIAIEAIHATPAPRYGSQPYAAGNLPHATPQRQMYPSQEDGHHPHSVSGSVGYLANRWNLGNCYATPLSRDNSVKYDPFIPSSCSSNTSGQYRSHVRLALSLEGKAELVPNNESSPVRETPSRPSSTLPSLSQYRQRSLHRSHSALPAVTLPPISTLTNSLPPRLVQGRSRDVHAWELCADSETRDELTAQAEHESSGSAIAAISLLRSTSGILQPSSVKRNAPLSKLSRHRQSKKPRLGRTASSVARLETCWANDERTHESSHAKMNVSMLVSPSDSDKENWSPRNGAASADRRRQMPPSSPSRSQGARRIGRALQGRKSPALLMRAHTMPSGSSSSMETGVSGFGDVEAKAESPRDDEVSRFMCGDVSPSKKGDMDCVAGLLSLSQGAWR
ncbi:homeobox transcriptional regulator [Trichoderma parareesei]|uniref:Homeobox transcriptional regulator n=1 Tax=Trichoderma parareesei TaxID=858221 RepID=A0A2H2ZHT8_TRIPA|nr:homeobox transcriptional regulator [Trichoderma parareesei]